MSYYKIPIRESNNGVQDFWEPDFDGSLSSVRHYNMDDLTCKIETDETPSNGIELSYDQWMDGSY